MASDQIINDIYKQIDILARRIERLQNNAVPTVPIYDPTNFPQDPLEGQIVLGTDDNAWKYWDGVWKIIGTVPDHIVFFNRNLLAPPSQEDGFLAMYLIGHADDGYGVHLVTTSTDFSLGNGIIFENMPGGTPDVRYSSLALSTESGVGVIGGDCVEMIIAVGADTFTGVSGFKLTGSIGGIGTQLFRVAGTGQVQIYKGNWATSDPGNPGELWLSGDTVKISL